MDVAEASERISELVSESWETAMVPMLLSALGTKVAGDTASVAKSESGSLRAFIEQNVQEVFVVQHQSKPTIVGAVPRRVEGEHNWDSLLDKVTGRPASRGRYHPAFWAAFRKPIAEADRRYLTTEGTVRFADMPIGHVAEHHMVEVPRELIAAPDATDADVHKSIGDWFKGKGSGVSPERFRDVAMADNLPTNDILGKLIQALDPDELSQVSMPMPIVAKLRRKAA